jgi:SET domain
MIATAQQHVVSRHVFAQVLKDTENGYQYLYSTQVFKPGDILCSFGAARVYDKPSYLTLQTGDDTHIIFDPEFLQYINHGCNPNVFFDTTTMQLVCLQQILPGDQFTFFYPSTEWRMAQPFTCRCGAVDCIGQIGGASQVDRAVLSRYRLTDYILSKL